MLAATTADARTVLLIVALLLAVIAFFVIGQFMSLYVQAVVSNAHVGLLDIIGMRLRKVDLRTIVYSRIRAIKAGFDVPVATLESHYLAGGRVPNVISAMIASKAGGFPIGWEQAAAHDLAGHDILAVARAIAKAKGHGLDLTFRAACDLDRMTDNVLKAVDDRLAREGYLDGQTAERAAYRKAELEPWLSPPQPPGSPP